LVLIAAKEKLEIVSGAAPPPFRPPAGGFAGGFPRPDLASGRKRFGLIQEYCTRSIINFQFLNNMLTQEEKDKIIKKCKLHDLDTGSPEVQIALLTEEIKQLLLHLKKHAKDFHSKRGLLKMVSKRRSLLDYLKKESTKRYNATLKKVGLKK